MIISKKKLEQIVQQRIKEKEEQQYILYRIGELEKELHGRIDKLCEAVWRLENTKTEVKTDVWGEDNDRHRDY